MNKTILLLCSLALGTAGTAQELKMTGSAPLNAVYGEVWESDEPLPMNDLGMEFGYALYEAEVTLPQTGALLEPDHVRDYAAVYLDGVLQGTVTDARKSLALEVEPGRYTLRLYVENIGRITYGPEILDNSKGLFGSVRLGGEPITDWRIIPLEVREAEVESLAFGPLGTCSAPCFRRGSFDSETEADRYLDVTGWGMGEVWINGSYLGSYWDEEKQQSIRIPAETLRKKGNRIIVFDLKNNDPAQTIRLADEPVFK